MLYYQILVASILRLKNLRHPIICQCHSSSQFKDFFANYLEPQSHLMILIFKEIQFTVTVNHNGNIGFGLTNQEDLDQAEQVIMGVTGQNSGFLQNADGSRSMYKLISAKRVNSQVQRLTFTRPLKPLNCDFELTSSTIRLLWSRYEGPISQTNLQGADLNSLNNKCFQKGKNRVTHDLRFRLIFLNPRKVPELSIRVSVQLISSTMSQFLMRHLVMMTTLTAKILP